MDDADAPLEFADGSALAAWLERHHAERAALWVLIHKVASGRPSVTWDVCVVEAIRFGWIDGRRMSHDGTSFLQRLTPRKPRSNWSARNVAIAERLIREGRMAPAGLAHVEAARADGRWETAYAGSADMEMPTDLLEALDGMPEAKTFFETLNRQNLYAVYHRLATAKRPETRAKRMASILDRFARGDRFH